MGTQKALNFAIEKHDVITKFSEFVLAVGEGSLNEWEDVRFGSFQSEYAVFRLQWRPHHASFSDTICV